MVHIYARSPSPRRYRSRSRSPPPRTSDDDNPGNNLYITGLSTRVTEKELEDHFMREGKVTEARLVVDPRTRESRGFGFVTMSSLEEAERAIKYCNRSILEGRVITVERAKRKRARTPTPGKFLGVRTAREVAALQDFDWGSRGGSAQRGAGRESLDRSRRSPRYSPYRDGGRDRDRSPRYSPYRGGGSSYRGRDRDRSRSPRR
eukprot:jgi/Mesen1/8292/ME000045S07740